MRAMAFLASLACLVGPGCIADADHTGTVRLELQNEGTAAVSAWLRAEDADGSILMQAQVLVQPGGVDGRDQVLVTEGIEQFRAVLVRGMDERTLARGADADCRDADTIVFRVVAGDVGTGPSYDMQLTCD